MTSVPMSSDRLVWWLALRSKRTTPTQAYSGAMLRRAKTPVKPGFPAPFAPVRWKAQRLKLVRLNGFGVSLVSQIDGNQLFGVAGQLHVPPEIGIDTQPT
jgi:hypothetical protein